MTIPIRTRVERDHRLRISEWRDITKVAWEAAGELWHEEILPLHFEVSAYSEYRYKRRESRYEERKFKRWGHRKPLTWTGDLQRRVTRIRDVRVVGDNSRRRGAARVVLYGPRYLFAYRKDLNQPDKARELRTVSRTDASKLARRLDQVITAELGERARREEVRP